MQTIAQLLHGMWKLETIINIKSNFHRYQVSISREK